MNTLSLVSFVIGIVAIGGTLAFWHGTAKAIKADLQGYMAAFVRRVHRLHGRWAVVDASGTLHIHPPLSEEVTEEVRIGAILDLTAAGARIVVQERALSVPRLPNGVGCEVFDEGIAPLAAVVLELCKEHNVECLVAFQAEDPKTHEMAGAVGSTKTDVSSLGFTLARTAVSRESEVKRLLLTIRRLSALNQEAAAVVALAELSTEDGARLMHEAAAIGNAIGKGIVELAETANACFGCVCAEVQDEKTQP